MSDCIEVCCRWRGNKLVEAEVQQWRHLFTVAALLTVPVFLLTVVFSPIQHSVLGFPLTPLLKWAFTSPVQVLSVPMQTITQAHLMYTIFGSEHAAACWPACSWTYCCWLAVKHAAAAVSNNCATEAVLIAVLGGLALPRGCPEGGEARQGQHGRAGVSGHQCFLHVFSHLAPF